VIQIFATGHSQVLAMEFAGRAGGLVPTNQLSIRDLVLFGGSDPAVVLDPRAERNPELASRVLALADVRPADVFVIASNSGSNGAVVEMARLARLQGHPVVAITSLAHTSAIESSHRSGLRLVDIADVAIDNGSPLGDAVLQLADGSGACCAVSSVTGIVLVQMIVAETIGRLEALGVPVPVYRSNNLPGGDEWNRELEAPYAGRVRRTA
jgi:uncharacterized phosphosugar-binding protein